MGKSALKHAVFRRPPLSTRALILAAPHDAYPPDALGADAPRWVFEDACVRLAGPGRNVRTGHDLVRVFVDAIHTTFALHPAVHTYVLCFDKPRYVPERKRPEQERRTGAAPPPPRPWVGPVVVDSAERALPQWSAVRANRARAIDELVECVSRALVVPRGCRVLVDWQRPCDGGVATVMAVLSGGRIAHARAQFANTIGEADLCAQHYVALAGREAIVLRTKDTDFLPISMAHYRGGSGAVYVALGTAYTTADGAYCTRTTPGARAHHELYDIRAVCRAVTQDLRMSVRDFVAVCVAAGNDYVRAPRGGHARLFAAATRRRRLVHRLGDGRWYVAPRALATLLRDAAPRHTKTPSRADRMAYYDAVRWSYNYISSTATAAAPPSTTTAAAPPSWIHATVHDGGGAAVDAVDKKPTYDGAV